MTGSTPEGVDSLVPDTSAAADLAAHPRLLGLVREGLYGIGLPVSPAFAAGIDRFAQGVDSLAQEHDLELHSVTSAGMGYAVEYLPASHAAGWRDNHPDPAVRSLGLADAAELLLADIVTAAMAAGLRGAQRDHKLTGQELSLSKNVGRSDGSVQMWLSLTESRGAPDGVSVDDEKHFFRRGLPYTGRGILLGVLAPTTQPRQDPAQVAANRDEFWEALKWLSVPREGIPVRRVSVLRALVERG